MAENAETQAENSPAEKPEKNQRAPRKRTNRRTGNEPARETAKESVAEDLAELAKSKGVEETRPTRTRRPRKATATVSFSNKDDGEVEATPEAPVAPMTTLLFQEPDVTRAVRTRRARRHDAEQDDQHNSSDSAETAESAESADSVESANSADSADDSDRGRSRTRRRRRGSRGGRRNQDDLRKNDSNDDSDDSRSDNDNDDENNESDGSRNKRTRTRRRSRGSGDQDDQKNVRRRRRRRTTEEVAKEVASPKGSTRLAAKRRRSDGRRDGRRRHTITESEYLARRESVARTMLVREHDGLNQIAILEDGSLVEHFVARHTQTTMVGNVYLGRVQNVLPSMEAAFVDIGKGRNAVLYAGEVNWEAAGMEGKPRRIEQALKSGDTVLVQVTKDPIGHKGARLTGQITLAGRHLVLVPSGAMTGISRKLPEKERTRLKKILKKVVPSEHGVIVRTAAEGATEEQLAQDVKRLMDSWEDVQAKSKHTKNAPSLLKGEPELAVRVVRDIFNEDFESLKVQGNNSWETILEYVEKLSPDLVDRLEHWTAEKDIFADHRVDEQLAKAFDRKVFLPSGGSLIIERTEAMTVVDVNTGKFTGTGGTLEETVTKNNLEAAEEIVRQLRLRDIGGIIVIDFIDMVLEANRDLVLRRLIECLGRDRTRHQVAEVTSLGLVQMTRKRVGQGLVEAFSTTCEHCEGRGYVTHDHPVEKGEQPNRQQQNNQQKNNRRSKQQNKEPEVDPKHEEVKAALNNIAAAASHKAEAAEEVPEPEEKRGRRRNTRRRNDGGGKRAEERAAEKPAEQKPDEKQVEKPAEKPAEQKPAGKRRVSSAGTITPAAAPTSSILSFPVKKKES